MDNGCCCENTTGRDKQDPERHAGGNVECGGSTPLLLVLRQECSAPRRHAELREATLRPRPVAAPSRRHQSGVEPPHSRGLSCWKNMNPGRVVTSPVTSRKILLVQSGRTEVIWSAAPRRLGATPNCERRPCDPGLWRRRAAALHNERRHGLAGGRAGRESAAHTGWVISLATIRMNPGTHPILCSSMEMTCCSAGRAQPV